MNSIPTNKFCTTQILAVSMSCLYISKHKIEPKKKIQLRIKELAWKRGKWQRMPSPCTCTHVCMSLSSALTIPIPSHPCAAILIHFFAFSSLHYPYPFLLSLYPYLLSPTLLTWNVFSTARTIGQQTHVLPAFGSGFIGRRLWIKWFGT